MQAVLLSLRRALLALALLISFADPALGGAAKKRLVAQKEEATDSPAYGEREDVMRLAREFAERKELDAGWVEDKIAQARFVPSVARLIMPPPTGTAKNWNAYRARFVEPLRIRTGLAFWNENAQWLEKAEQVYGVPAQIVVGIIGVETIYGQHMGTFRVIDALATLAFDFPPGRKDRSEFFRSELEQLFVLCKSEGRDPLELKGSYAGAMGMPQFMPSSWNKYAVDFDGDGHVDLHHSAADVIGSVAHYLAEFGWVREQPAYFRVLQLPEDASHRTVLLEPDIVPTFSVAEFTAHGAQLTPDALSHEGKLALIELQNGSDAPSYVAGTQNFYAITRYNWSSYYAMAVIDLGAAVARERGRQ
jgi:membrane-bound lytic murein transglycosylase B